ncbi:SDR family NAD(P)-dependent oxidoreductase [Pigmentiphaga aceris]|uniref:SDR family NAD(P)-dependent oxidoreductase n=1 Tax=Pigmentiphaga aceris TaxID=1940612 RepID=A0A5C0AS04_9BURK|nr:SDR family NAD(P)-dependent oxidoreductase [Pigmentiphaga aceris]QEI04426.1 SDR family NAD(P)-dependent oxidoreductase [Pigmentiphaga aceris]
MFAPFNTRIVDWNGQRVWLIGASTGIGAALAQALLARGARVAMSARSQAGLEQTARGNVHAMVMPFDATNPQEWSSTHDSICNAWDGLDLVIFCAASYQPMHAWELKADEVRASLETNIGNVCYGLEAVLPKMMAKAQGGLAIVASVAGYVGLPGATLYGPTKAALINLAELLYSDLKPKGLDVYLINPGFVKTRLTARNHFSMPALLTTDQAAEAIIKGFGKGKFEIHFPRRFTSVLKVLRQLPYRWRFALIRRTLGL